MRSRSSAVNDVIYSNYITLSSGTLWNIPRATFFLGICTRAFGKIKTQNIPRLAYIFHTLDHDYYHYEPSHLINRSFKNAHSL